MIVPANNVKSSIPIAKLICVCLKNEDIYFHSLLNKATKRTNLKNLKNRAKKTYDGSSERISKGIMAIISGQFFLKKAL